MNIDIEYQGPLGCEKAKVVEPYEPGWGPTAYETFEYDSHFVILRRPGATLMIPISRIYSIFRTV